MSNDINEVGENARSVEEEITAASQSSAVADRIEDIPAADAAAILRRLSASQAAEVAEILDPTTAAGILSRMDPEQAGPVLAEMQPPEASMVLSAMASDDRVDILGHVSGVVHDSLMRQLSDHEVESIRRLEQYPSDSAGGMMKTEVTALPEHFSVGQAIDELRRLNEQLTQMFYVYVIDARRHLIGVLSMRDLILAHPETLLSQMMRTNVASVPVTMDQGEVARLMRRHGYLALPVVDQQNKLMGLITVDDVVDVLEEEATEDVQRMFGAGAEERLTSPWLFSYQKRVGWLLVNLVTAVVAASVVGMFESVIAQIAVLAVYMPIIAGTGGNASAQAMAVAVRGMALNEVDTRLLRSVLRKQLLVGMLMGATIGTVTGLAAGFFHSDRGPMLGVVVGLALVINHSLACVCGVTLPFIMKKLGFDPAQSATIFATTITDVVGFFSLLGLAWMLLI